MLLRYSYFLVMLLLLNSCGGTAGTVALKPDIQEISNYGLPELASLKAGSDATGTDLLGARPVLQSSGATVVDDSLELPAAAESLEWAIWRFNPGELDLAEITVNIATESGGECFIGISDYVLGRWDVSGPYNSTSTIFLDPVRHASPHGNFYVAVLCHDGNDVIVDSLVLTMQSGWVIVPVATYPLFLDLGNSLASIAGRPAIAFVDDNLHVRMARSSTASGSAAGDWSLVDVSQADTQNTFDISLAEVQGRPAIAYPHGDGDFALAEDKLIYAIASNADGLLPDDWMLVTVTTDKGNIGTGPSLAVINGKPAISAVGNGSRLHYFFSSSSDGASALDWQSVRLDPGNIIALETSLLEVDGRPAIAYSDYDGVSSAQSYVKYAIPSSASWMQETDWQYLEVALSGDGTYIHKSLSLSLWQGKPALCYFRENTFEAAPDDGKDLWMARADSADGSSIGDWTAAAVDASKTKIGSGCSMLELDSQAVISYYDADSGELKLARSTGVGPGGIDWQRSTIDGLGRVGDNSSIALIDGHLAISYLDYGNGQLKYAVLLD